VIRRLPPGVIAVTDWLAGPFGGRGGQRRGAVKARKAADRKAAHVADLDEQFGDRHGRQSAQLSERRAAVSDELGELTGDCFSCASSLAISSR
jgi:hypothetical protein